MIVPAAERWAWTSCRRTTRARATTTPPRAVNSPLTAVGPAPLEMTAPTAPETRKACATTNAAVAIPVTAVAAMYLRAERA